MSILFFIIVILIVSILLTILVFYILNNFKTLMLYLKLKISKIEFPKIKLPKINYGIKTNKKGLTIIDSPNPEYFKEEDTTKKINPLLAKNLMWIIGGVLIFVLVGPYFMRYRRRK